MRARVRVRVRVRVEGRHHRRVLAVLVGDMLYDDVDHVVFVGVLPPRQQMHLPQRRRCGESHHSREAGVVKRYTVTEKVWLRYGQRHGQPSAPHPY